MLLQSIGTLLQSVYAPEQNMNRVRMNGIAAGSHAHNLLVNYAANNLAVRCIDWRGLLY